MTLRTPRRRISPRTKRRYRAIREFFRRALGSTSDQEIKINSSIAVNVTDLKRKIVGLEEQIDDVNKHCRDIAIDTGPRTRSICQSELNHGICTIGEQTEASSEIKCNGIETLYNKPSETSYRSEGRNSIPKQHHGNVTDSPVMVHEYGGHVIKPKNKKSKLHKNSSNGSKLYKRKTRSAYDNIATACSTSSFHSLANTRIAHLNGSYTNQADDRKRSNEEYMEEIIPHHYKDKKYKENIRKNMGDYYKGLNDDKPYRNRTNRQPKRELDEDFIADIIRRQYKPVKMFGRKKSDLSQFSAPICRDQEYSVQENIIEGSELCSCFYDVDHRHKHHKHRQQDLNEMRSVCDTRLYSSKKHLRNKHRKTRIDTYSNSDMYDLVPVKERTSPKTRRKFVEHNNIPREYYREVPPSPRTLRPRLNLKAQYCTELDDYIAYAKHHSKKLSPNRQKRYQEYLQQIESDVTSDVIPIHPECNVSHLRKSQKHAKPMAENNKNPVETRAPGNVDQTNIINETLIKPQDIVHADKTDKALCEIKDILQSFLHEIKRETISSHGDKSDIDTNGLHDTNTNNKIKNNGIPNGTSFNNNYSAAQCGVGPYMAPIQNPCCYPVMTMCPMNACPMPVPNGYMMPSQSYTCTNCANCPTVAKESNSAHCCNKKSNAPRRSETDELIKEIYKFVAQPVSKNHNKNDKRRDISKEDPKILTSRSVGGSYKNFLHDAKVGTPPLKCYSKSCEAIGSRLVSDPYYARTTPSYSDTLLEKLSLEATTHSTSATELVTESTDEKNKPNKFSKVLRSFGLIKKKKKDVIEELSESESVIDVEVKPKHPPFRQEITNYMMHGQEYYHPPHIGPHCQRPCDYEHLHHAPREYHPKPHEHYPRPHEYEPRLYAYSPRHHDYTPRHESQRPNEYQRDYHPPYNPNMHGYPSPQLHDRYAERHQQRMCEHHSAPSPPTGRHPTAPPLNSSYDTSYSQMQPHLCLKEIEVKSTGTQSERKMSIFRKFKRKIQPPVRTTQLAAGDEFHRTFSTQTPPSNNKPTPNLAKPSFNWKSLQEKAKQGMPKNMDPTSYSFKTQKELAQGDMNIRNAVIKKLFYKRNPFSPRNLIMRTILGKDKSSYGDPPTVFRPRMFF